MMSSSMDTFLVNNVFYCRKITILVVNAINFESFQYYFSALMRRTSLHIGTYTLFRISKLFKICRKRVIHIPITLSVLEIHKFSLSKSEDPY